MSELTQPTDEQTKKAMASARPVQHPELAERTTVLSDEWDGQLAVEEHSHVKHGMIETSGKPVEEQ